MNLKRNLVALTPWRGRNYGLCYHFLFFNFRRALIGYSNGLNFNDVICLVARTKRSGIGIFESNWTCLVPSVFIGFYGFYGFCGLSGKPSEQSFLICIKKKKIEKGKTLRTKKVVDIENENLVTSRKCCGLLMQGDVF